MNVENALGAQHAARIQSLDRPRLDRAGEVAPAPASLPKAAAAGTVQADRAAPLDLKTLLALQQTRRDQGEARDARGLTEEEQRDVEQLKRRDREVRRHEQAHANAGGPYAGQPSYEYVTGPDRKQYAVTGHVSIDTGSVSGNPKATIRKMATVKRAALAPMEPSSTDRAVAAAAEQAKRQAKLELRQHKAEEAAARTARGQDSDAAEPGASASVRAAGAYGSTGGESFGWVRLVV